MENLRLEKVLLIEDNEDDSYFIEALLKRCFSLQATRKHFEVIKTGTITQALEIVESQAIDFIFLDLAVSQKQSIQDYFRLRRNCPVSPIILMTEHYNLSKASEMIAKGAQDYILKSKINQDGLERVLKYGLERAETLRLKQEILNMVIHDLKTPITITTEAISFVLEGMKDNLQPAQHKFLTMAHRNMGRLSEMVNNLQESTAIELGQVNLHKKKTNITRFTKEIADGFLLPFKAKRLEFKIKLPDRDVYAEVDEEKLSHVLLNLIGNALKYTDKGSVAITLVVNPDTHFIECSVEDTGPGIAKEDCEKVFLKYGRSKDAIDAGKKGLGLGLAIAKSIVEAHGGKILLDSVVGKGTKVTFKIPHE